MGDGGVLLTDDDGWLERARSCATRAAGRYEHVELGLNSRLDELHAAILRSAMLPRWTVADSRRRRSPRATRGGLEGNRLRPILRGRRVSAHHLFPVEVIEGGAAEGIADGAYPCWVWPSVATIPESVPSSRLCEDSVRQSAPSRSSSARRARALPADPPLSTRTRKSRSCWRGVPGGGCVKDPC